MLNSMTGLMGMLNITNCYIDGYIDCDCTYLRFIVY